MEKYKTIIPYNKGMKWIIYEKIDGSNVSFKKGEDGKLTFFSRNRELEDIENEKVFNKLLGLYDSEFYKIMEIDTLYFGELLGMAKIPYNRVQHQRALNEELFIFDMFRDGDYLCPAEFLSYSLGEFKRPSFQTITGTFKEIDSYIQNEDVISAVDGVSKIEGYIVKSFYSNSICFKKVSKEFAEGINGAKKEAREPNKRYLEKWVQKWVYEEPVKNIKTFIQNSKQDFENENPGVKLATKMLVPLIIQYDLCGVEYKEIQYTDGMGVEHTKKVPINLKRKWEVYYESN